MSKSKKNIVQTKNQIDKFIKELRTSDFEKYEILIWLRNIVWDTLLDALRSLVIQFLTVIV
ncbi:hypothetical protein N9A30_00510 [Flavobacteriaceae bacterium]|nr:hypothetical protein [Flavobacteriaceae bacterium]MDA9124317.1 hypothetical protein [bacterium]MDB4263605.1 hypothetical protein [Flavobacteriaceae bacterium]MDC0125919.1 hypothetical protein [Flavobacteriaceae bacterium]